MAQITIEIKDGYEVTIAKEFAKFSYGKIVPTTQEHLDAIQSHIYSLIDPYYKQAIEKDPEVLAKKQELEDLIALKEAAIKGK